MQINDSGAIVAGGASGLGEATARKVAELVGSRARPVPIGPELLANLDEGKRLAFLKQWQAAMKGT